MKIKDIIIIGIFILIIILLSSFFFKKKIDTSTFVSVCDQYELKHYDVTKQFESLKTVKEATIGESSDLWQIEFYVLNSNKAAKEMYDKNFLEYNSLVKKSVSSSKKGFLSYSEYTIVTNYRYYHVCRIKNTLLYINVPMEYQKDLEEIIHKLGY